MSTHRLAGLLATVAVIVALLAGCAPSPAAPATSAPAPATKAPATSAPAPATAAATAVPPAPTSAPAPPGVKTVTISFTTGDPESLNPIYASQWIAECAFDLIYLPLWNLGNDGVYVPELAEEVPTLENGGVSEDGLTVVIKLRQDAVWSDGTPVTADDAVFTYQMILDDRNSVGSRYPFDTYIADIQAEDAHTLKIIFSEPYVDWATAIFTGISRILPKHVLEPVMQADGTLDNAAYNRLPTVVNGPFLVTEFEPGSHLTFVANDRYWRGRPKLDKIFFRLVEDRAAQLTALASGQADIGSYILGSELADLKKMGNNTIQTADNGYQVMMFLNIDPNTASPAMTDPNVRRALALGIDRQLIIDKLYQGLYEIPATYWYGTVYDNPNLSPYPFDPVEAGNLLDAAGWVDANGDGIREKDGQDLVLRYAYISGDQAGDTMVVTIQQMLADVGVKVELLPNTKEVLWASYTDGGPLALGEYDLTHWSDGMWYFPAPDTSYFLCSERPSADYPSGYNWFGICDEALDSLFAQEATEVSPQKRIELFYEIGKMMYDQTLIIPLRNDPDVWAVSDRLADVTFSGIDPLMTAYEWDVK